MGFDCPAAAAAAVCVCWKGPGNCMPTVGIAFC